jgi:hypothetical protein
MGCGLYLFPYLAIKAVVQSCRLFVYNFINLDDLTEPNIRLLAPPDESVNHLALPFYVNLSLVRIVW